MGNSDLQPCESYCILRQGSSWFALPALAVREVSPSVALVAVPESPPLLAGLCHLRNEFLAVVRLGGLAGDPITTMPGGEQLAVLAGPVGPWALLVDEVAGLEPLDVSIDAEARLPDSFPDAVLGSATYRERVVRVLDPNRLFRVAERELCDSWTEGPSTQGVLR